MTALHVAEGCSDCAKLGRPCGRVPTLNPAGDEIRRQERLAVETRLAAEYADQHVATFGAVS